MGLVFYNTRGPLWVAAAVVGYRGSSAVFLKQHFQIVNFQQAFAPGFQLLRFRFLQTRRYPGRQFAKALLQQTRQKLHALLLRT